MRKRPIFSFFPSPGLPTDSKVLSFGSEDFPAGSMPLPEGPVALPTDSAALPANSLVPLVLENPFRVPQKPPMLPLRLFFVMIIVFSFCDCLIMISGKISMVVYRAGALSALNYVKDDMFRLAILTDSS